MVEFVIPSVKPTPTRILYTYLPNVTLGDDVYEHDESNSLHWSQLRHRSNINGNLSYFVFFVKYIYKI